MDELAGKRGTLPAEREAQFSRFRETIERIASNNFDSDATVRGAAVRIFAKHIRSAPQSYIVLMTSDDRWCVAPCV
jgi:hypothetical protein